ncbi:MAG: MarC family protein [Kiritimatiellae bacterium]|nr:MarC family protein [Kiritimatiellia bacterium]
MNQSDFLKAFSTATMLFLVLDPLGNLPLFVSLLKDCDAKNYRRIVLRESGIALMVLMLFLLFGNRILHGLQISESSLGIAGGVILFLIAIKMVFGTPQFNSGKQDHEPFIVPLAIPLFAGPAAIAVTILVRGDSMHTFLTGLAALIPAWGLSAVILLSGRKLASFLGPRGLDALESLMGFLLAAISVGMLIHGIKTAFGL